MSSPEVLDFAKLLAPIPGEKPTGSDLRDDPSSTTDFQKIREARKLARASEKALDVPPDNDEDRRRLLPPDWGSIIVLGKKTLIEKSKDLEVAAYLIEALVRINGFAGLRDGYRLCRELIGEYWDGLYPSPQEGEVQDRFSHVLQLSGIEAPGALIVPIRKVAFTDQVAEGPFNLTHYQQAKGLAAIADAKVRQKRIDEGAITLDKIQAAIAATPAKFYADLVEDIGQAGAEFQKFCTALSDKSGFDPPSSDLLGVLETYLDTVKDLARDKIPKVPAAGAGAPAGAAAAAQPSAAAEAPKPVDPGVIQSRQDAFERLKKIADYFREHEPQSVIPYALDQVANWGKMSLPELLSELIPDEAPRKNVFKQVGIKLPETKK